jgi:transposase
MTKTQVEVITSVQRRRRWSRAEKERIVEATMEPGAVASEIARAAGIPRSQFDLAIEPGMQTACPTIQCQARGPSRQ